MIVLCHGYADSKASMLGKAAAFHAMGFSTFLIDFRGSGGSEGNYTTVGFEGAADVVTAASRARELLPGKPLTLYGRSMGGAAILRAVSVNGLETDSVVIEAVFDRMLSTIKNRFEAMRVPSFPCAQLLMLWGGRQMGFCGFGHNPADYAAGVRCPVLVLHGEHDKRATSEQARNIFDRLAGPKRIEIFPGIGHESCYGADPGKWKEIVSDFLCSASQRG